MTESRRRRRSEINSNWLGVVNASSRFIIVTRRQCHRLECRVCIHSHHTNTSTESVFPWFSSRKVKPCRRVTLIIPSLTMMPCIVPLGLLALSAVCTSAHVQRTAVPDMLMSRQVDSTTGSAIQTNAQAASSASSTTSSDKDQHVYEGNLPVLCVEGCSDSLTSYG